MYNFSLMKKQFLWLTKGDLFSISKNSFFDLSEFQNVLVYVGHIVVLKSLTFVLYREIQRAHQSISFPFLT